MATDQGQNPSNLLDPQNKDKQVHPAASDLSKKPQDPPYRMPPNFLTTDVGTSGTSDPQLEERLHLQHEQINNLSLKFDQLSLTSWGRDVVLPKVHSDQMLIRK